MKKLGVLIVGLNGAVASTLIAGVEAMVRGLVPRLGMVTERTDMQIEESISEMLDFAPLESIVFGGWDVRFDNVFQAAQHHKVLPNELLERVRDRLEALKPWPAVFSRAYAQNVIGDRVVVATGHRQQIELLQHDIESFKRTHELDRVILVNLASTEAYLEMGAAHQNLKAFEAALDRDDAAITPAMRYFYAAAKLGIPYVNFTPSLSDIPALAELSAREQAPYAGMDGKTGQTLMKTALAAMLRVRRLKIEGWYSTNILGNGDGLVLNSPDSNKTKVMSKASVLDSIVGYHVENHQVHIHYYKPRGDSKEAWDNIDLVGFAGMPMQMKVNFLCQDSVLAAPLVVDLVRLLDVAKRVGESGIQRHFSVFFKSPHFHAGEVPVHDLFKQEKLLLDWVRTVSGKLRASGALHPNGAHAQDAAR